MQLDSTILRRCKQVIQELQADLTKKTAEVKLKDEMIQNLLHERNNIFSKNQQLQQLIYQLKQANVVLRGQIRKAESSDFLEKEINRLQGELQILAVNYQNKQIENKSLEERLRQESDSKKDMDKEIQEAMREIMLKMRMLEEEIAIKDEQIITKQEENQRLKSRIDDKKCQYCDAISDIKNLNSLRKKIDDNLKSNTKLTNQNYFRTGSTKKSTSLMKELSSKKNILAGSIANNNTTSRVRVNEFPSFASVQYPISASPMMLNERSAFQMLSVNENLRQPTARGKTNENIRRQNIQTMKKNCSINQEAVNATLRQIEEKLKKMSEKLEENEESDMSTLSIF